MCCDKYMHWVWIIREVMVPIFELSQSTSNEIVQSTKYQGFTLYRTIESKSTSTLAITPLATIIINSI